MVNDDIPEPGIGRAPIPGIFGNNARNINGA